MDSTIDFFIFSNVTIDSPSIHVKLILKNRNFQAINISKIRKTFIMKSSISMRSTTFLDNEVIYFFHHYKDDDCINDEYIINQSDNIKNKMFSQKIKLNESTILTNEINLEKASWQFILKKLFLKQEKQNSNSQEIMIELFLLLESKHLIKGLPINDFSNLLKTTNSINDVIILS